MLKYRLGRNPNIPDPLTSTNVQVKADSVTTTVTLQDLLKFENRLRRLEERKFEDEKFKLGERDPLTVSEIRKVFEIPETQNCISDLFKKYEDEAIKGKRYFDIYLIIYKIIKRSKWA